MRIKRLYLIILYALCAATSVVAQSDTIVLGEANVKYKKVRYTRKNNPAVELMRKVIAAKDQNDWQSHHEFTSVEQYNKVTFSLNEVSPSMFSGRGKTSALLREHIEVCNATGKLILPISMTEVVKKRVTRRATSSRKDIIIGERHSGIDDLLDVGEIVNTGLKDVFTEVNIMDDDIRFLQHRITSPLSRRSAISFYHFFISDTLSLDGLNLYEVTFAPANHQDFGFSGRLLIAADSTYQVQHAQLRLPKHTGINWIDGLNLSQSFADLPTGERVLAREDMVLQLKIVGQVQKFQAQRSTVYSNFTTEEQPAYIYDRLGPEYKELSASLQPDVFWEQHRPEPLSLSEQRISGLSHGLLNLRGFKPLVWVLRAIANNTVPLTIKPGQPQPVDITPINTLISFNQIEKVRLRLSARTTPALLPHLFLEGYVAYGFGDKRWKGRGEVTYAFNKPKNHISEFPVNNLSFSYQNDLMAPTDKFLGTDKDNVFTSLKWAKVQHMMYFERFNLKYDREWMNGLRLTAQLRRESNTPVGELRFTPLSQLSTLNPPQAAVPSIEESSPSLIGEGYQSAAGDFGGERPSYARERLVTSQATLAISYTPGATYYSSKKARYFLNREAPVYSLRHTVGLKGVLGGQYNYNLTELDLYRRFQLNSWGHISANLGLAIQWNKVPYPLLITPPANLSYIKAYNTFELINNMEFLNDRSATLMLAWDLQGKLFNRIPLFRKLKWREFIGLNMMWGTLTRKNDPTLPENAGSDILMQLPGSAAGTADYQPTSFVMNPRVPYVEGIIGIHNILNLLHVEYVHRFTYRNLPTSPNWGIRLRLDFTF